MTREEIRDLYLELTDLLVYKDSVADAKKRVNDLYENGEVITPEDFQFGLLWEFNEETGKDIDGLMFITIDWKATVEDAVWRISNVLGELSTEIAFPKESDIEKDANYSINTIWACGEALREKGIEIGGLYSPMDCTIWFLTSQENFENVYSIFEKLSARPTKLL